MAASLGKNARLTLTATRLLIFDINKRSLSTSQICCGHTTFFHAKPSRRKEIYNAPIDADKFPGLGDIKEIKIPDKIERSPTAILEALASTVKNNVNQPIYKSIDDPHLYASNDRLKKQYLSAMDSGNKTAQMMLSMYPDYFTQIWEEPLPDSYRDASLGYKFKDSSEEALLERIEKLAVEDAVSVYKDMMANENIPSQETQEKLLELLAVFNCKNYEAESDLTCYVTFPVLKKNSHPLLSTWKKENMALEVFNSLPNKTAKAYCSIIRGMAVNYEKNGAMNMYNEMKAANLSVDVYTYNQLLTLAYLDSETLDDVKLYIEVILRDMASNNVKPDVETFNSVIFNCRRLSRWSSSRNYVLSVLSEMKACGIEPTLSTYETIIRIFYYHKDKTTKTPSLFEKIMDEVQDKEHECLTEGDVLFFRTTMKAITAHFPDPKYALRLHQILQTGKNSDFLGHRQMQFGYYFDLFTVITPLEHIDVVMELYSAVVPFIFSPPSEVYISLLESIKMYDAYGYLPQIYTDIQSSTMFSEKSFVDLFSQLMSKQKHAPQLQGELCDIATSIVKRWQESRDRLAYSKPYLDGSVIGHFIITFLNNDNLEKSWKLFQLYQDNNWLKSEHPSKESLTRLAEHLIAQNDYTLTKEVLNHMHYLQYTELSPLVEKILQTFTLSDQERNFLEGLATDSIPSSD